MTSETFGDVEVTEGDDLVAFVEICRPPNNFFDVALIGSIADAYEAISDRTDCRAIVLCSEGKHFCAGADFSGSSSSADSGADQTDAVATAPTLYGEALRLIEAPTPVVAAVHGAAIGGGLGLACSADFRVACSEARFAANFAQLGFHHGFGLSVTLPPIVGHQRALELLYTGRRVRGDDAAAMSLADRLVALHRVRDEAQLLAAEIATSAPLAVRSIRATMRADLGDRFREATEREASEQARLRQTADWSEGIRAAAERRAPRFEGR